MKKFLLSLSLVCASMAVHANDYVWCMVANTGQAVPLSNVSYILAEGSAPATFSIVLKSGDPVENVGKVRFAQTAPNMTTGIDQATVAGGDATPMLSRAICGDLVISNAAAGLPVSVYSIKGQLVKNGTTSGETTTVSTGDLTSGVYILKVGDTALKFMKK